MANFKEEIGTFKAIMSALIQKTNDNVILWQVANDAYIAEHNSHRYEVDHNRALYIDGVAAGQICDASELRDVITKSLLNLDDVLASLEGSHNANS